MTLSSVVALSLLLFGVILGLLMALLVYFFDIRWLRWPRWRWIRRRVAWSTMQPHHLRRTIAVLQQLQVLLVVHGAGHDPALADVQQVLRQAERHFGATASLEDVIQSLVGYDLTRQRHERQARRAQVVLMCSASDAPGITSAPAAVVMSQVVGK